MRSKDASSGVKGSTKGRAKSGDGFLSRLTPSRIALGVIAVLTLIFIFENTRRVRIRMLSPEVTMPLYLALLATWVLGGLCGGYLLRRRTK